MLQTGPHRRATMLAPKAKTVGDLFRRRAQASADHPAVYRKVDGVWKALTWAQFYEQARRVARTLLDDVKLERGDRVAILGPTQLPWAIYDMGCQLAGMTSFGIYPKQAVDQVRYIIDHSDAKVVFVDEATELETVLSACEGNDKVSAIVPWDEALVASHGERDARIVSPMRFTGEPLSDERVEQIINEVDPDDTALFVYTSGTTGPPKGAMITHANIISLLSQQGDFLEVFESDISLSFLPMAHAAERILAFYGRINAGFATAYASSISAVLTEMAEVQPTIFGSVPRIFEKAYGKIQTELAKKPGIVRWLFGRAVKVGKKRTERITSGRSVGPVLAARYKMAETLVFKKVRAAFGGRVRFFITGAAPTGRDILDFFWAAGLPIYEAYGMTESTVITHINRIGSVRLGTVGRVIPPMECRIVKQTPDDPAGEVAVKGPFVFKGYFKNPEATAETIRDGWLHTGDVGYEDADGYLRITDRIKHLIITAGGKNLTPANIENAIKNESPLIHQVHAHGDKRSYISAIIAPSPQETMEWGVEKGLIPKSELDARMKELLANPAGRTAALNETTAKLVVNPAYQRQIRDAVARGNTRLANVEKVKRFHILERDFSQEAGELTPTMKLKRREIEQKFTDLFDRIYSEEGFALEP